MGTRMEMVLEGMLEAHQRRIEELTAEATEGLALAQAFSDVSLQLLESKSADEHGAALERLRALRARFEAWRTLPTADTTKAEG